MGRGLVTIALGDQSAFFRSPIFAARYAKGRWISVFYLGVNVASNGRVIWSKSTAWKLILAKEGILSWCSTAFT